MKNKRGNIYLFSGPFGGKTTNALGIAMRALGHNKKVLVVQFLKWMESGEYHFQNMVNNLKIVKFGRSGWKGLSNLNGKDRMLCLDAINFIYKEIETNKPDILVLDELNLVAYLKLLTIEEIKPVIEYCSSSGISIIITGRNAPVELIDMADVANKIVCIKEPKFPICEKGIQW